MVSLVSDDQEAAEKIDKWLDEVEWLDLGRNGSAPPADDSPDHTRKGKKDIIHAAETRLLASDYSRSVINYEDWHFASASNLVVVDNMPNDTKRSQFIAALTNGLPKYHAAYRAMLPSPLVDDTHVAAVRIFNSREEYLGYVGLENEMTAALWHPQTRELVLHYPLGGFEALLRTIWHEALHQHLDYACSMIHTPAWFNEGHAELFEHSHFDMDGNIVFEQDPDAVLVIQNEVSALAEYLPALFSMDYPEFYSGTADERQMKYRLAWSVAYFLQIGAPDVRFQPFKNLRADLMKAVVSTQRRDEACRIVLTDEVCKKLIDEWLSFWRRR